MTWNHRDKLERLAADDNLAAAELMLEMLDALKMAEARLAEIDASGVRRSPTALAEIRAAISKVENAS